MSETSEVVGFSAAPSRRTRVRRQPQRGHYDRALIYAILDEGFVCHVGVDNEEGPIVIPTAYARIGDRLYLHGAVGNALLQSMSNGTRTCITVTLVDGLVLARSTFHHSINYRSVVIFAIATEVIDNDEKRAALEAVVEHLVPGRSADARPPSDVELRMTRVVSVPLDEASAKVRSGNPVDEEADLNLPVWAGQIPLPVVPGTPIVDTDARVLAPCPEYATHYARRRTEN